MFWAKAFVNVLLLSTTALAAPRRQHYGNHDIEKRASSYWMENIQRQGTVAFGANPSYSVFRNVKDFGAAGDGSTDDTAAINNAITAGNRCGQGCNSSTTTPAIVYFPAGTYRITAPLIMYYYTAMIGDATNLPTIRGDASFSGIALLDSDPYIPGANGAEWYTNQNQFFRQVRNLVIDLTQMPPGAGASGQVATGIHWQVAQACSLQNVQFNMVPKSQDNKQQGIMMENGSGMFFSNVSFSGGNYGIYGGTQQMTTRDVTFNGQNTAIMLLWDWLWTFKSLTINNCDVGVNMSSLNWTTQSQTVGSVTLMDSVINANVMGVATAYSPANNIPATGGTLLIQNVDFSGMGGKPAVANDAGTSILPGGSKVAVWGQGHAYMPPNSPSKVRRFPQTATPAWPSVSSYAAGNTSSSTTTSPNTSISFTTTAAIGNATASTCNSAAVPATLTTITQAGFTAPTIPAALLDSTTGGVFERNKPQYETVPVGNFVSVKSQGAKGDGVTDDSDAIQAAMTNLSSDQILYFDHGAYRITKTINVPKNIKMTGEIWPLIMFDGTSATFSDVNNPQPGFSIGNSGDSGAVEITDLIFETLGPAPGCIMMEWNVEATSPGAAAMWDTHFRVGGSAGTELQQNTCEGNTTVPAQFNQECYGSFLMLHITQTASAYIENTWYWLADHELDIQGNDELNIFNGRGVLIESQGPTWLVGTSSEHSVLYNYQVANAKNLWMGAIQTETPYFQSGPDSLNGGFTPNPAYSDPTFDNCGPSSNETCKKAWGLRVVDSTDVFVTGAGLYSFYEQDQQASCLAAENCQENMVDLECSSNINIYDLVTKASVNQIMLNGQPAVSEFDNVNLFGATVLFYEQQ